MPASTVRDNYSTPSLLAAAAVERIAPACILFHDPAFPFSGYDVHRRFYGRARTAVATCYKPVAVDQGWDVRCRV
jgi:hypothetical protein